MVTKEPVGRLTPVIGAREGRWTARPRLARITCNHSGGPVEAEVTPGASTQEVRRATTRLKVREHRQRLRAQGMRPIQIWVPDVRSPEFAAEARRQSLLVAQSPEEAEIQSLIDSVLEWPNDEYGV